MRRGDAGAGLVDPGSPPVFFVNPCTGVASGGAYNWSSTVKRQLDVRPQRRRPAGERFMLTGSYLYVKNDGNAHVIGYQAGGILAPPGTTLPLNISNLERQQAAVRST